MHVNECQANIFLILYITSGLFHLCIHSSPSLSLNYEKRHDFLNILDFCTNYFRYTCDFFSFFFIKFFWSALIEVSIKVLLKSNTI